MNLKLGFLLVCPLFALVFAASVWSEDLAQIAASSTPPSDSNVGAGDCNSKGDKEALACMKAKISECATKNDKEAHECIKNLANENKISSDGKLPALEANKSDGDSTPECPTRP